MTTTMTPAAGPNPAHDSLAGIPPLPADHDPAFQALVGGRFGSEEQRAGLNVKVQAALGRVANSPVEESPHAYTSGDVARQVMAADAAAPEGERQLTFRDKLWLTKQSGGFQGHPGGNGLGAENAARERAKPSVQAAEAAQRELVARDPAAAAKNRLT